MHPRPCGGTSSQLSKAKPPEHLSKDSTYGKKSTKVTAIATKANSTRFATSRITKEASVWLIEAQFIYHC